MMPEQRLEVLLQLCDLTAELQRARPDADRLHAPSERSPEALAPWTRLMHSR